MNKQCEFCHQPFQTNRKFQRYCMRRCQRAVYDEKNRMPSIGRDAHLPTGTVGALSEYRVVVDLMLKGYHVFRACSPHAPCDLVVFRDGQPPISIEVQTAYRRENGSIYAPTPSAANVFDVLAQGT